MVLDYLSEHPRSTKGQIVKGTEMSAATVGDSLRRLKKAELVNDVQRLRGPRNATEYVIVGGYDADAVCDVDVCGKHYTLTGEQIRKLRRKADKYVEKNRGGE